MGFFSLYQLKKTLTIKNKKRITLIAPYKSTQVLIFYQDCSYAHIQLFDNKTLHEGKLDFVVTKIIKPEITGRGPNIIQNQSNKNANNRFDFVCLVGQKDDSVFFGILNIGSDIYKPYQAVFYEKKEEFESVNYHLFFNLQSKYPFLVQITLNVENGLMLKCFDAKNKSWLNDILYLGSKFLNYQFVAVPSLEDKNKNSFCLLANGQKSESVHIACISIEQNLGSAINKAQFSLDESFMSESNENSIISSAFQTGQKSMHFTFTKEIKYYRNFTIIGCCIDPSGFLFMIGNSLHFQTKEKKSTLWQPVCNYINYASLMSNLQVQNIFISLKNFKIGKQIIVREYLGTMDNDMMFIVQNPLKKSIHKLSPGKILQKKSQFDEEIHSFDSYLPSSNCQISQDTNSIFRYELVCEQFFQKIKDSPSVIKIIRLLKISKRMYYREMLQKYFPDAKNEDGFVENVLSFL